MSVAFPCLVILVDISSYNHSTHENDSRTIHMTQLASKDILNNAVLADVTSTVWYISPDISEEHAVHIFKTEKVTEKCQYISTRPHSIISLRNIHHSQHHEMLESHKDTIIYFICTG